MTIAIDLSPLQGPHRLRGVGSVIINILNNISASDKKKHNFVFFMDHTDKQTQTRSLSPGLFINFSGDSR